MLRRRRQEPDPLAHVQPDAAPARWRGAVRVALEHRRRFQEVRGLIDEGPLHDRVRAMAERIDRGVLAVWELVQRGAVAEQALAATDPDVAAERLKQARRSLAELPDGAERDALAARVDALAAGHASAQRLWNTVEDLGHRLELLEARLGSLVAQAAELAAGVVFTDGLDRAEADLDAALLELDATRAALDEVGRL